MIAPDRRPQLFSAKRLGPPAGALLVLASLLSFGGAASATWSIVAVDQETGRVGAALASCVPAGLLGEPDAALVPVILIPGQGAAITQGSINPDSPPALRKLLVDGFSPQDAVNELQSVDEVPTSRQYGIAMIGPVDRDGASHTFTGVDVEAESSGRAGSDVAVQGQLLADAAAVDVALVAFEAARAAGDDLETSLVAALAAGSNAGGDRRCDAEQTALFAHLVVADPGDEPTKPTVLLTVTVDEGDGQNPVTLLVDAFASGQRGWVDAGLNDPAGVPRIAVGVVGLILAVAAFFTLRKGLGSPSARR